MSPAAEEEEEEVDPPLRVPPPLVSPDQARRFVLPGSHTPCAVPTPAPKKLSPLAKPFYPRSKPVAAEADSFAAAAFVAAVRREVCPDSWRRDKGKDKLQDDDFGYDDDRVEVDVSDQYAAEHGYDDGDHYDHAVDDRQGHNETPPQDDYDEDAATLELTTASATATAAAAPRAAIEVPFAFPADYYDSESEARPAPSDVPPYARAFLACPSSRLQELPRRLKTAWQAATKCVAQRAMDCLAVGDAQGYGAHLRLFLKLPARSLALPKESHGAARANTQRLRLLDLAAGKLPPIPEAPAVRDDAPSHAGPAGATTARGRTTAAAGARQAKRLVEQGLSSRALRALERGKPAAASANTLARLQALHPANPTDRAEWPDKPPRRAVPHVTANHLAAVAKELPRGSAPGPSGWTFELVLAAINRQPTGTVAAFLVDIAQRALYGTLPWRELLCASRLVALGKPDGGVRPIAVGEAIYRVIGRLVLKADKVMAGSNAASYVGRFQYGIAYPGGVEAPVHAIREMHGAGQLRALVSLDWRNAFNSIDRVHTARRVASHAPGLARLYEWSYRSDSILVLPPSFERAGLPASLLSQAGVRQGDVLGPLFFSIGAAHILEALATVPSIRPWAYLDDILVAVPHGVSDRAAKAAVAATFATAEREGHHAGLRLNRAKSVVWAADADHIVTALANSDSSNNGEGAERDGGCAAAHDGIKILGAPVGSKAFVDGALQCIVGQATKTLDLVAEADGLPLQHKLILLRQCVTQIPTFWARAVPDAAAALEVWDEALVGRVGALVGVDLTPYSFHTAVAHLPVRLGGLGLRAMSETAPRAFAASVLFAAALARERDAPLVCSAGTAQRLKGLLPELALSNACDDADAWRSAIERAEYPPVDTSGTRQLQRELQGRADTATAAYLYHNVPLRLASVFEDAATPGSGTWLGAVPSDPTLTIPDAELAKAIRAKLLFTPANAAAICPTCHSTTVDPSHAWTCVSLSHLRTARHDAVVRRLGSACRTDKAVLEHVLAAPTCEPIDPSPSPPSASSSSSSFRPAAPEANVTPISERLRRRPQTPFNRRTLVAAAMARPDDDDDDSDLDDDGEDSHNRSATDDDNYGDANASAGCNNACAAHYTAAPFDADDTLDASHNEDDAGLAGISELDHEDDDDYGSTLDHYDSCSSSSSGDGGDDPCDLDYEFSGQNETLSSEDSLRTARPPTAVSTRRDSHRRHEKPSRPELRADLWLPATSVAVDVVVAAACHLGRNRAFERAAGRKRTKYGPAVRDGTVASVVPFVVSPFGVLAKPAKAFLKKVLGASTGPKLAKARLRLAVATVRGTARLCHAWSACAVLGVGDF